LKLVKSGQVKLTFIKSFFFTSAQHFQTIHKCRMRNHGTPTEPGMNMPGITKQGTTKSGPTFFECDQAKNDQAWNEHWSYLKSSSCNTALLRLSELIRWESFLENRVRNQWSVMSEISISCCARTFSTCVQRTGFWLDHSPILILYQYHVYLSNYRIFMFLPLVKAQISENGAPTDQPKKLITFSPHIRTTSPKLTYKLR
jgi:hypothetical protein